MERALLAFVFMLVLPFGCGGGSSITSDSDLNDDLQMKFTAVRGSGQAVGPRLSFEGEVVFEILDANGSPIADAAVEFSLFNASGAEEVTAEKVLRAWDEGLHFISDEEVSADLLMRPKNETVGWITKAPDRTGRDGRVAVAVDAPADFGQTIVLAARTKSEAQKAIGFTLLRTEGFSPSSQKLLLTSGNQLSEISGQPFDLFIVATDAKQGFVETSFNGEMNFSISVEMQGNDLKRATVPEGEFTCYFGGGQCLVPGGPFLVKKPGMLVVTVIEKDLGFGEFGAAVGVTRGGATDIELVFNPPSAGGKYVSACEGEAEDESNPCIRISADADPQALYPLLVDGGGNYVGTSESSWVVTGPLEGKLEADEVIAFQNVYPDLVGKGKMTVSTPDGLTKTWNYEVYPGVPASATVVSENDGVEVATTPFGAKISLFDQHGNFCANFSGPIDFTVDLINASTSPVGDEPTTFFSEQVSFTGGVGLSVSTVQATNSNDQPYLRISSGAMTDDSPPIEIHPGATHSVEFRTQALNAGVLFDTPVKINAQTSLTIYLAGYDVHGNYNRDEPCNFHSEANVIDSMIVEKANTFQLIILPDKTTGSGTVIATPVDTTVEAIESPEITVTAGAPVEYRIKTENNFTEQAGVKFFITVEALDDSGIIAEEHNGAEVPVRLEFIANNSWSGREPTLPVESFDCGSTGNTNACNYKCNFSDTPGVCKISDVVFTDSLTDATITVFDPFDIIKESDAKIVDVQPGEVVKATVLANLSGGPAVGAVVYDLARTFAITADDTINISAAGIDDGGNYITDEAVVFSAAGAFSQKHLSTSVESPAVAVLNPGFLEQKTGTVTAQGETTVTMHFTVSPGEPASVRVRLPDAENEAGATLSVDAGECVDMELAVVDADGNVADYYNSDALEVGIGISNSTASPVVYRAEDGQDYLWQNDPVGDFDRVRFVSGFYQQADSKRTIKLLGYDQKYSEQPYDYFSGGYFASRGVGGKEQRIVANGFVDFPYKACFADATDDRAQLPVIDVSLPITVVDLYGPVPSVEGSSGEIAVNRGAVENSYVQLWNADNDWLCSPRMYAQTLVAIPFEYVGFDEKIQSQCTNWTADSTPDLIKTRYADRGGNDLGEAQGDWSFDDKLEENDQISGSQSSTTQVTLLNTLAGTYREVFFAEGNVETVNINYRVYPGEPDQFDVVFNNNNPIVATERFNAKLILRDEFGNITSNRNSDLAVNFSYNPAPSQSPAGSDPEIEVNGNRYFYYGQYIGEADFFLPKAGEQITITVDIPSLTNGQQQQTFEIKAGPPSTTRINSSAAKNAPAAGDITTDDLVTWYLAGYDSEGNWSSLVEADFTATGVFDGRISVNQTQESFVVDPVDVGAGTISASPKGPFSGLAAADTGELMVRVGDFSHFELSVGGVVNNTVVAGAPNPLVLRALDSDGNVLSEGFPETVNLNWSVSDTSQNPEGRSIEVPANGAYNFAGGECSDNLQITAFNSLANPVVTVQHADTQEAGSVNVVVNSGDFDHFGVQSDETFEARFDNTDNTFQATVYWRDEAGNNLDAGGPADAVELTIVNADGSAANGALQGSTSEVLLSEGVAVISDLSYQAGGLYRILAADGQYSTPLDASTIVEMSASRRTVKEYAMNIPSDWTAGTLQAVSVTALDAFGVKITSNDADLSEMSFSWSGASNAPNGNNPILPSSLGFEEGTAQVSLTFYKAETIDAGTLMVVDNQAKSGVSSSALVVGPAALHHYDVAVDPSTQLKSNTSTRFAVTVKSFDSFDNPRNGQTELSLVPTPLDGHEAGEIKGAVTTGLNASSGELTVSNLWYDTGGSLKIKVGNTSYPTKNSPTLNIEAAPPLDATAPQITGRSVVSESPSSSNYTPTIAFTLDEPATVTLYSDSSCETSISSQTSKTAGPQTIETNTLEISAVTAIYIKGFDALNNYSDCLTVGSYTTQLAAPTLSTPIVYQYSLGLIWGHVDGATSYNLYWSTSPGVTISSSSISGVTSTYFHEERTTGTLYYYRIGAVKDGVVRILSNEVSASPAVAPDVPTDLTATAEQYDQISLAWQPPADNGGSGVTDYIIEYSNDGGSSWLVFLDGVSSAASATVTGLVENTEYSLRVAAVNASATGDYSSVVDVQTPLAPWSDVTVSEDTTKRDNSTDIWWSTSQGTMTWQNASAHCDGLEYNGRSDWRLPTIEELEGARDNGLYPNVIAQDDWSGWSVSSWPDDTSFAMTTTLNSQARFTTNKNSTLSFACVRQDPWSDVSVSGDITKRNNSSGLWWSSDQGVTQWFNIGSHCDDLDFNGRSDWRAPSKEELEAASGEGITGELSIANQVSWSFSQNLTDASQAYAVDLSDGSSSFQDKDSNFSLLCVTAP